MTMREYQELTPDAEMFARVWKRVMPDESLSRIVVHTQEGKTQSELQPTVAEVMRSGIPKERELLREVLEEMEAVRRGAGEILRRDPGAWPLLVSVRESTIQFRAAWLLLTGEHKRSGKVLLPVAGSMESLLRAQYAKELRLSELCRELEDVLKGTEMEEIPAEQRRESGRRRRMLRHLMAGRT